MGVIFTNVYLQNLKYSYQWYEKFCKTIAKDPNNFPMEIWNQLYDPTVKCNELSSMRKLRLSSAKRTAIILLGFECCGKTSYAMEFINKFPNFELVSIDSIILNIYFDSFKNRVIPSEKNIDELAVRNMGIIMQKSNKNLIIDGNFVHCHIRGALIKTLREIGYDNIILFNFFNASKSYIESRLFNRTLELLMYNEYQKKHSSIELLCLKKQLLGKNPKDILFSEKTSEEWQNDETFKFLYNSLYKKFYEVSPKETALSYQIKNKLFKSGVDTIVNVF